MNLFTRFALIGMLVLGVIGARQSASAASLPAGPSTDACKTVAAHKTVTLGPGVSSVQGTSIGAAYRADNACHRYVLDVKVPYNSGAAKYEREFNIWGEPTAALPATQAGCEAVGEWIRVYRKGPRSTSFSYLGGGVLRGVWTEPVEGAFGGGCELKPSSTFQDYGTFSPPVAGTAVYRVALATRSGRTWKQVRATTAHPAIIY